MFTSWPLIQGHLLIIAAHLDDIANWRRSYLPATRWDARAAKVCSRVIYLPSMLISILLKWSCAILKLFTCRVRIFGRGLYSLIVVASSWVAVDDAQVAEGLDIAIITLSLYWLWTQIQDEAPWVAIIVVLIVINRMLRHVDFVAGWLLMFWQVDILIVTRLSPLMPNNCGRSCLVVLTVVINGGQGLIRLL